MLRKFRVSNFKGFEKDFELDLTDVNGYEFNKDCTRHGIVNNALIYGHNGVGKSNLALAIFDIIEHLTDRQRNEAIYKNYLNAYSDSNVAEFYFEFLINSKIVSYEYRKTNYKTIAFERFDIDGEELVYFDRVKGTSATVRFKGAESLKKEVDNPELSILKYIKNNTELDDDETNETFRLFFVFIDKMLYFRALTETIYLGLEIGVRNILEDIANNGNVRDFEGFLNEAGIDCRLSAVKEAGRNTIVFDFNGTQVPFAEVASTGTFTLTLFYFRFQSIQDGSKVSLLFIDEFDAFYHHSLSELIVDKLKKTGVQFILTTHNTSIISNDLLRPDCYFLMTKSRIRSLSKSTPKELREAHNIEKMYKAGAFDAE